MREEHDGTGSTDTAVVRGIVISLFGRWNWWLGQMPARLLRVDPSLPGRLATEAEG